VKELFAIAFTCVYLLLTVGVIQNTPYCMGRINTLLPTSEANSLAFNCPLTTVQDENAEFFIMNDLYSKAFVVYVA